MVCGICWKGKHCDFIDSSPDISRHTGTLSLAEATAAALANNAAIKESLREWNAAKARITQAGAWDDPRVAGESRVHRYVDIPPNAFTDQSASIEQAIPITGKNLPESYSWGADVPKINSEDHFPSRRTPGAFCRMI